MYFIKTAFFVFSKILFIIKKLFRVNFFIDKYKYSYWQCRLKHLGKDVKFYKYVVLNNPFNIKINDGCRIGDFVLMWGGGGIDIGRNTLIAAGCIITSEGHNIKAHIFKKSLVQKKIIIGNNVWIGANTTILPGVKIESGSIIAAGSVVSKNIPKKVIAAGIPAKIVKLL